MNFGILLAVCLLYGGANYYVASRIYRLSVLLGKGMNLAVFAVIFAVLSATVLISYLSGTSVLKRADSAVGSVWMGLLMYLFLFTVAADVILLILRIAGVAAPAVKIAAEITVLALTAIVFVCGFIHSQNIQTAHYEVDTGKNGTPAKIVLISDIHIGALGIESRLDRMAEKINAENPDIVCIAGDIFNNDFSSVKNQEKVVEALSRINARCGVYACLGNHDCGNGFEKMLETISAAGITLLSEDCRDIADICTLWGRADSSPIGYTGEMKRENTVCTSEAGLPVIVMDHNPSNIDEYGSGVSLVLCGHTHKGQVFPCSLITGPMYRNQYGMLKQEDGPVVIVTSGIGYWGPPLRIGSDSEIAVIELR